MRFDVVRAWKDETYRQTLSDEQRAALPAHPAGELNDDELTAVCGGFDGPGWYPYWIFDTFGTAVASTASTLVHHRHHSWGVSCDIDIYSNDIRVLGGTDRWINIGTTETHFCVETH